MGYTLKIGQLLETTTEQDYASPFTNKVKTYTIQDVQDEVLKDAPAYGEPTDYTNARWPSYTAWEQAMVFVGLGELMFSKQTGLLRKHPGCVKITTKHKEAIDKAHKDFYEKYPNAKAGYSLKDQDSEWPIENSMAARLEWLKYWVDWALLNCSKPVFYNS